MKDCMMHKKISQLDKNKYRVEKSGFIQFDSVNIS